MSSKGRISRSRQPVTAGSCTDVGCVRAQNEDSLLLKLPLMVVADGIGGQEAGEIASSIAVETMEDMAPNYADAAELGAAVESANHAVMDGVSAGRGRPGMGTTMTAAVIDADKMVIAQVGDSRAYRYRNGKLEQLTHDHSLVGPMVESGQITEEEARTHPSRSIITRALGSDPDMKPDLFEVDVRKGDRVLLCSDGLSSMISTADIERVLQSVRDPQKAADKLVEAAKQAGGLDNVTVIVANVSDIRPFDAPEESKRHRFSAVVFIAVALVLVALAVGGFFYYMHHSAYLVSQNGYVTLYAGRIDKLGDVGYQEMLYETNIPIDKLPPITAERLEEGIQFDSRSAAEDVIEDYREQTGIAEAPQSTDSATQTQQPADAAATQTQAAGDAAATAQPADAAATAQPATTATPADAATQTPAANEAAETTAAQTATQDAAPSAEGQVQ